MRAIAIAAITLDGMIARTSDEAVTWTSKADKRMFAEASRRAGVIVMGRPTYEAVGRPLKDRLQVVLTSVPGKYAPISDRVEYRNGAPAAVLHDLEGRGYREVIVGGGSAVYRDYLEAGVVDELWLTVEPLFFGRGISLLGGAPFEAPMRLLEVVRLDENAVQLKYSLRAHDGE
jgi:dihydrofolate reductase